jgi:hypothetical protein
MVPRACQISTPGVKLVHMLLALLMPTGDDFLAGVMLRAWRDGSASDGSAAPRAYVYLLRRIDGR